MNGLPRHRPGTTEGSLLSDTSPSASPTTAWALVTGSTSGIGRETALRLAEDGYAVIVTGRNAQRAAEVRGLIESNGGCAVDLVADLADPAAIRDDTGSPRPRTPPRRCSTRCSPPTSRRPTSWSGRSPRRWRRAATA